MPHKALSYARAGWRVARREGPAALAGKISRHVTGWLETAAVRARRTSPRGGIKVAVYANWDAGEAIRYLTPRGAGVWGPVHFGLGAEVPDPDFVLILNSPSEPVLQVTLPPERVWFAAGEPPEFEAYHAGQGYGTVVLTCDPSVAGKPACGRDVILAPPILQTWQVRRSIDQLAKLQRLDKTKVLSWVTSNKDGLPGHKLRMFFLRTLHGRVPFDLFGRGFEAIDDKWDAIAPYRYSIAFENSRAPHYFSEKLMDCFVCLTLPLYYGSPEIQKYFPAESFIPIEPSDPRTADKIRDIIASDLWRERQDALQEARWLVLYKYNMFSQVARLMLDRMRPATPPQTIEIRRV